MDKHTVIPNALEVCWGPTRYFFIVTLVGLIGCDKADRGPSTDRAVSNEKAVVVDDDPGVRACVNRWLTSQSKEHRGEVYFDPYVSTPLDTPNQNEFMKLQADIVRTMKQVDRESLLNGGDVSSLSEQWGQTTIAAVQDLDAVRKWEIVDVQLEVFDAKHQADFGRQGRSSVKARIDSSKPDGTPIIKVWTILLFKNHGKWGIYSIS